MNRTVVILILVAAVTTPMNARVPASCDATGFNNALSSGGIVDATGCGNVTLSSTVTIGVNGLATTLLLGSGTYTFNSNTGDGFVISGSGSRLIGQGPINTTVNTTSAFTGTIIRVEPVSGQNSLNAIEVSGFRVDQTNTPGVTALKILSVRDPSTFHNLDLRFGTGTAINITTSTNSSALIPQGIGLRDIYIQTSSSALTADTVVVTGNQIYLGSNVKIVSNAPAGVYRGLVIKPTATTNGDGRYNTFFSGAIAGYGTCLSIESATGTGAATGSIGNVIGPGNTFENCSLAYQMTGDSQHLAIDNWAFGNQFVSTVTDIAKLDYAQENFIQEITNGNTGTVALTANSLQNTVFVRMGNLNDVSNSGTSNLVFSMLTNTFYFNGTVSKAGGSFRIDHPLDPEHKFLQHSFVESPDMMNVYNGVVTLGKNGRAEIRLPAYFQALNRDYRYQLTAIGQFAPLYVAKEIENNRFTIGGGKPGTRVSWQVTGIRKDDYANQNRIKVEVNK
jgi:hypothetical protein